MSDYEGYETIATRREGKIMVVSLNRPEKLNAVNPRLHFELSKIFEEVGRDTSVDVVVFTGEGRSFCAGGDLDWIRNMPGGRAMDWNILEAKKIVRDIIDMPQPVIAAVNGVAAGLGATLALFCDVIFVGESTRIADPHVRVGLVAGDGGAAIWPLLVGVARAKEYLMTGDFVNAQDAERMGLVNRVVPDDKLMDEAMAFAQRLAQGSQPAIRLSKRSVNRFVTMVTELVLEYSLKMEQTTFGSNDVKEGATAILEKRAPAFTD